MSGSLPPVTGTRSRGRWRSCWSTPTATQVISWLVASVSDGCVVAVSAPQFCVVAIILAENFTMDIDKPFRPRPACLTCQVADIGNRMLKGVPFLVGYGLQPANNGRVLRSGTYKAPDRIRDYVDPALCAARGPTTRETYCVRSMGEQYRCDTGPPGGGATGAGPGVRDYGALLINRVGRSGYKIMWQVVMLLWDFKYGGRAN